MANQQQIQQALDEGESLKMITQAYSEIAAVKLRQIRTGIERTRVFFEEVSKVFRAVEVAAAQQKVNPKLQKKDTVSILLTSNHRFYGNLEEKLIRYFILNTTKFKTDRIIVGKTALEFLQAMKYAYRYTSVVFRDDNPSPSESDQLVGQITGYEQILVYYPRMESTLVQEPHVVDLLQQPPKHYLQSKVRSFDYIFEPELEKILKFFDQQIISVLLEQTFLEADLARTAARLVSMDEAQAKAEDFIKDQRKLLFRVKMSADNMHLLETLATVLTARKEKEKSTYAQ